jgi:hypothetical protein
MPQRELSGRVGKRSTGILALVPLDRAHVGEKVFHRRLITGEELAVEMAGIQ